MGLRIGKYDEPAGGCVGWVEPEDRSWILFIGVDGQPLLFMRRDETGGVL